MIQIANVSSFEKAMKIYSPENKMSKNDKPNQHKGKV